MAHNINSLMYVGDKPWHGLGKKLDKVATSAEAIEAAGMSWKVNKEPIFLKGVADPIEGKWATVREDTHDVLGVVGDQYKPLQNKEAFSFFDAIVGIKEAMYHTAGALGKGERVWILAKLPGYIKVKGDDVSEKFLLLANSHDGTKAVSMMFTPIRVVCQNTLNVAIGGALLQAKVRHTTNIGQNVSAVREQLGIINQKFSFFEEAAQKLATVQLTKDAWTDYLKTLKLAAVTKEDATTRMTNITEEVSRLFETGKGAELVSAKGTAWGAFNAVVEYVDYFRGSDNPENRAKSLLFGTGATLKQSAWDEVLKLAK
jgi:phage/plasmid-like protein (TIGR03299 family)